MTELPQKLSDTPEPPPSGGRPPTPPLGDGGKAAGRSGASRQRSPDVVKGLRVLLVEKDSIFALAAEDMLLRNGASRVDVATTRKEALLHLETAQYDVALIDLKLAGDGSRTIAARLQALSIPFAFAAEHGARAPLPPGFADRMVIGKPCSEPYLMSCLAQLLGGLG